MKIGILSEDSECDRYPKKPENNPKNGIQTEKLPTQPNADFIYYDTQVYSTIIFLSCCFKQGV